MTTTAGHQCHETHAAGARRRQLRMMQLFFTGAAVIAMLALFDAARPDTTETVFGSGPVRLTDTAIESPAPASGPVGCNSPKRHRTWPAVAALPPTTTATKPSNRPSRKNSRPCSSWMKNKTKRPSSSLNKACSRLKWTNNRPTTRKPLSKRGGREVRPSCAIWATSRSRIRACNSDQRTALID